MTILLKFCGIFVSRKFFVKIFAITLDICPITCYSFNNERKLLLRRASMVFILNPKVKQEKIDAFILGWEQKGFSTILSEGTEHTAVCLIGNTAEVDLDHVVHTNDIVAYGKRITERYKAVNRTIHEDVSTVIEVGGCKIGEGFFPVISGPCSVESEEQLLTIAKSVKQSGARILRGGAFKPRSSPYDFQGMQADGLELLRLAKKETGLPIVSEIMNQTQIDLFVEADVDIVQIGARNMQNFDLLKAVGGVKVPVLLKRGLANTIEELLMSAEYIVASGNPNVILCERGIRTFETMTRNTLDLSAVVLLKQKSHLPVIADPSHAAGIRSLVAPLAKAIIAVGADGIMIETHNDPASALCDGAQSLDLQQFDELMVDLKKRAEAEGKII
jgi:3-deoxy-7-phosphoheptulonate synthase